MPHWCCNFEKIDPRTIRHAIAHDGKPISYRSALELLERDASFRDFFIKLLSDAPFVGYRWETPPITLATFDRPFEFVLLDAPAIDRLPDALAFMEHFRAADSPQAVAFTNLGKDATLIAPLRVDPHAGYVHLAAFIRTAPREQVHAFWQLVAKTFASKISSKPLWLSTAGMGVAWLHVRIDDRPKYFGFGEYRSY